MPVKIRALSKAPVFKAQYLVFMDEAIRAELDIRVDQILEKG
jgi:hypothetical protein